MLHRWLLSALLLASGCSSGGGGGGELIPLTPWSSLRHDNSNSGLGIGTIEDNKAQVRFSVALGSVADHPISPALGDGGLVYVGTSDGLLSLTDTGSERWRFRYCNIADGAIPCTTASDTCIPVGPIVTSPVVTANDDLVIVAASGFVFAIHDDNNSAFTCLWASHPSRVPSAPTRSSPQVLIDPSDLNLLSVFVGTDDGQLVALNGDGSTKWRFPNSPGLMDALTSTVAISTGAMVLLTAPDSFLYALDLTGRQLWRRAVDAALGGDNLLTSPAVALTTYTVGTGGMVSANNPDGSVKWRYQAQHPILGSPAFVSQSIDELDGDRTIEPVVYVVDQTGLLYGLRDSSGLELVEKLCSGTGDDISCTFPEDCPSGQTCDAPPVPLPLTTGTVPVESSPAIAGDLFAVVGSADGRLCARALDGTVPDDPAWQSGCINVGNGNPLSSPVIDRDGNIYVTSNGVLYAIGS